MKYTLCFWQTNELTLPMSARCIAILQKISGLYLCKCNGRTCQTKLHHTAFRDCIEKPRIEKNPFPRCLCYNRTKSASPCAARSCADLVLTPQQKFNMGRLIKLSNGAALPRHRVSRPAGDDSPAGRLFLRLYGILLLRRSAPSDDFFVTGGAYFVFRRLL